VATLNITISSDSADALKEFEKVVKGVDKVNASAEDLRKTYVKGYADTQKYYKALDDLEREMKAGNVTMQEYVRILAGINAAHARTTAHSPKKPAGCAACLVRLVPKPCNSRRAWPLVSVSLAS
jgi:hypothetical protein